MSSSSLKSKFPVAPEVKSTKFSPIAGEESTLYPCLAVPLYHTTATAVEDV